MNLPNKSISIKESILVECLNIYKKIPNKGIDVKSLFLETEDKCNFLDALDLLFIKDKITIENNTIIKRKENNNGSKN